MSRWLLVALTVGAIEALAPSADAGSADEKRACIAASEKAQALRTDGKIVASRELYLSCARDVCPPVVRKDCARAVTEVDEAIPTIVLGAKDALGHDVAEVKVTIDDKLLTEHLDGKAMPIDPGEHRLSFETAGRATVQEKIVVREGEKNRVVQVRFAPTEEEAKALAPPPVVATTPSSAPSPVQTTRAVPTISYVLAGVGVVGLASFTYFGLSASSKASSLRDTCSPACSRADADVVKSRALVADVSLLVSVFALGGATILYVTAPMEKKVAVSVVPIAAGGVISFAGRF